MRCPISNHQDTLVLATTSTQLLTDISCVVRHTDILTWKITSKKFVLFLIAVMRKAFMFFDVHKTGFVETDKIDQIMNHMGQMYDDAALQALIDSTDAEGAGKVNFDGFCRIAGRFMEEEDEQVMQHELKEAFRMYDREGNGYITTGVLREILAALDEKLTSNDLDDMIEEIDSDGSGTVDFDEFMKMMTG